MQLSIQKLYYTVATIIGIFAILILAKSVLIPIAFAILLAFILFPVTRKLESWGVNTIVSALLPIFGIFLIFGTAVFLFSNQIIQLPENTTGFNTKVLNVFTDVTLFINKNFEFMPELERGELFDKITSWFRKSAGSLISQTFSSTASIIFGLATSIIFTFLLLIYKKGLVSALSRFYPPEQREKSLILFKSVHKVGQQYLVGMMIVILILGLINSIGLWIIGIDNPFLFGFLAAVLAVIPYAGTFLGAAIPVLYSFLSYDSVWMPIFIMIFFWCVQVFEGNFLTPKIVGGNLKLNALTSVLTLIIGAMVWGIAGMIVFLPFTAMLKVVCEQYEGLKPVALLMGEQKHSKEHTSVSFFQQALNKLKHQFKH